MIKMAIVIKISKKNLPIKPYLKKSILNNKGNPLEQSQKNGRYIKIKGKELY